MRTLMNATLSGQSVVMWCPGCLSWQVDYHDGTVMEFARMKLDSSGVGVGVDLSEWAAVLEDVLWEHLRECRDLRALAREHGVVIADADAGH